MFKAIRIILLLCILLFIALSAYTLDANLRDWGKTKWVVVYPINGDGSDVARSYIGQLQDDDFEKMEQFLNQEAVRFGVKQSQPFRVLLGPVLIEHPPKMPQQGQWYENIWWSLKLRFWASDVVPESGPPADIRIYVEYFDPSVYEVLPHSIGMKKLSLAVVKAFASKKMTQTNNIVMAHELLHIFGATDKYNLSTNLPFYPDGYSEPNKVPLYPQVKAEIMGGRIPLTKIKAKIPTQFKYVSIGELTAKEIGWLE